MTGARLTVFLVDFIAARSVSGDILHGPKILCEVHCSFHTVPPGCHKNTFGCQVFLGQHQGTYTRAQVSDRLDFLEILKVL